MDEKGLLELWNTKRTQIINAQIAPTLLLIAIFVLAAFGKFENATDGAKYLTVGVAAATGILAIISQYAAVREAESLLVDLTKIFQISNISFIVLSHMRYGLPGVLQIHCSSPTDLTQMYRFDFTPLTKINFRLRRSA